MKKVDKKTESGSITRERRYFSESARRSIVDEIDRGLSKSEASRKYHVSETSIYRWVEHYSKKYAPMLVKVIESKSEGSKYKQLSVELEQAYATLGRAKAEIDFLNAVIQKAGEEYAVDLKKNFATASCSITTKTKRKTP
jgi:hypothetical protein